MSLKSPSTYAEWYWKHGVDAELAKQEELEKELVPMLSDIFAGMKSVEGIPDEVLAFLGKIESPIAPAGAGILTQMAGQASGTVADGFLTAALQDYKYKLREKWPDLRIDPATAMLLKQRKRITDEMYDARMLSGGLKKAEGEVLYEAARPFPSIPEIMRYARYHDNPENPKSKVWEIFDVSELDYNMWWFGSMQQLTTDQVTTLYKWGFFGQGEAEQELSKIGWDYRNRQMMLDLTYSMPNPMLLTQGGLMQGVEDDEIITAISKGDIHPDYAQTYLDAVLSKPATEDIINYELRTDPSLGRLDESLKRIGVHPAYFDLYKELAYFIPPVQDLITMAVREAFSPEIAQRFGQYQDYPTDLSKYAAKKGVSEEWSKRYWAAHWTLPSPLQGFQMLHRGVITDPDLDMLLRAQDVMPFWRDKMKQIAYRVLTRVDVRRMYGLGVLSEAEVNEAYQHMGYNPRDAKRMTQFTVKYVGKQTGAMSESDIVNTYAKGFISDNEARTLLRELGVDDDEARKVIEDAGLKRSWKLKEQEIKTIEKAFKRETIDINQARGRLKSAKLGDAEISVMLERWAVAVKDDPDATWTTAQTLGFLKAGLITTGRAVAELQANGYNQERIQVYLQSASPPSPTD